jgi:transcriptional regulator with XRE-family HTH domain
MTASGGATAARLALGEALARLRRDARMSTAEASTATGVPADVIRQIEEGAADPRMWDVAGLYSAYGVSDLTQRAALLGLAYRASSSEWWHPYRDVIPGWLEYYVGLEQASSMIRSYAPYQVPALLQTADYARETIAATTSTITQREIRRRLELRLRRQQILSRPAPARLWTVIDEAALRRLAASRTAMRGQLRHLIAMCDRPNVTISILPFALGAHPATAGPLSIMRMPDHELPDIAILEHLAGGQYYRGAGHLDYFRHILNQLGLTARTAGPAKPILANVLSET